MISGHLRLQSRPSGLIPRRLGFVELDAQWEVDVTDICMAEFAALKRTPVLKMVLVALVYTKDPPESTQSNSGA